MSNWTRVPPIRSGVFDHRNLENANGRAPIQERIMFVGYVNWTEDPERGQGAKPMPLGSGKLRACRIEQPMTADSLTVDEWSGEWRPLDGGPVGVNGLTEAETSATASVMGASPTPPSVRRTT